jgi:hypothetical protein
VRQSPARQSFPVHCHSGATLTGSGRASVQGRGTWPCLCVVLLEFTDNGLWTGVPMHRFPLREFWFLPLLLHLHLLWGLPANSWRVKYKWSLKLSAHFFLATWMCENLTPFLNVFKRQPLHMHESKSLFQKICLYWRQFICWNTFSSCRLLTKRLLAVCCECVRVRWTARNWKFICTLLNGAFSVIRTIQRRMVGWQVND